jgi:diguanylate cyclase (GGDEF)-like protein/PAS domain S-box-containing protein
MKQWTLALAVPLAVLACSSAASMVILDNARDDAEVARRAAAHIASARVLERLDNTVSRLSTTGGLFAASHTVTEPQFREFTKTLVRDPTIKRVAYIDRVPAAERAAFERRIGGPIVDGGTRDAHLAPARREYYPYELTGPARAAKQVNAFDAAGEPVRAATLRRARDTGTAQTTAPVRTFRTKIRALLVFVPVYDSALPPSTVARRRANLRGYAVGVLPTRQLVPRLQLASVALLDRGRPIAGTRQLGETTTVPLRLAGRRFELQVDTRIDNDHSMALAVAMGGLLLALMIGTVLLILVRRDSYAQRLVRERLAEQRKAEVALEESERHHRLLAENASDWITLIDAQGRCTYSSQSVLKLLGREPADVVGARFTDLLHPGDLNSVSELLKAIGRGEDVPAMELRQRHADGRWIPIETTLTVIRDRRTGEVVEVQCASRDVTERHHLEAELRKLAVQDDLTGLPNRRGLSERLESELAMARRYGGGALLLIDLDEFKEVNDTLGHTVGDQVLCRVADLLRERVRESDHVARLGGDEFAAVLSRVDEVGAAVVAAGVQDALRHDPELRRLIGRRLTASVGTALMTGDPSLTAEKLLIHADRAMYATKRTSAPEPLGEPSNPLA